MYIQINHKNYSLDDIAKLLNLEEVHHAAVCVPVGSGTIIAHTEDNPSDPFPGISTDIILADGTYMPATRTEQPVGAANPTSFFISREDSYIATYEHDTTPEDDYGTSPSTPEVVIGGDFGADVKVSFENGYVKEAA